MTDSLEYELALERAQSRSNARWTAAELAAWVFPVLACAVAVAIFAPRFAVKDPSLIDDWFSLTYAPTAVHELLHGHYDAALVDYGGRYRPAYAVLNYLQWPLLGSRTSTMIPTFIGLARLFLFMAAVAALTAFFVRGAATRAWTIIAAASVPTLIIATRGMSYNFVRFGVAEPTAFAAITLSLFAITAAVRRLVAGSEESDRLRARILFTGGYLLYLFGVYMSEASIALVFVLPAIYFWLAHDPRLKPSRLWATRTVTIASVLLLAPLVDILSRAVPTLGAADGGHFTPVGLTRKLGQPAVATLHGAVFGLATFVWALLFLVVLGTCVRRAFAGDRQAVLIVGMLATGTGVAYLSNFAAADLSRYYVAWIVAVAVACAWLMMGLRERYRWLALAAVAFFVLIGNPRAGPQAWAERDRAGSEAISLASEAYATGCPVYLVDFPAERRMGLARMMRSPSGSALPITCRPGSRTALAVIWQSTTMTIPDGCKTTWRQLERLHWIQVRSCSDFRQPANVRTQDFEPREVAVVRLVPPTRFVPASRLNRLRFVTATRPAG